MEHTLREEGRSRPFRGPADLVPSPHVAPARTGTT